MARDLINEGSAIRDAFVDCSQALELQVAMPYVTQFKAHEIVYEYDRLVARLFERNVEEELRYAASEACREGQATK